MHRDAALCPPTHHHHPAHHPIPCYPRGRQPFCCLPLPCPPPVFDLMRDANGTRRTTRQTQPSCSHTFTEPRHDATTCRCMSSISRRTPALAPRMWQRPHNMLLLQMLVSYNRIYFSIGKAVSVRAQAHHQEPPNSLPRVGHAAPPSSRQRRWQRATGRRRRADHARLIN